MRAITQKLDKFPATRRRCCSDLCLPRSNHEAFTMTSLPTPFEISGLESRHLDILIAQRQTEEEKGTVRRVTEGTASVLVHSGLTDARWRYAMECHGKLARHTRFSGRRTDSLSKTIPHSVPAVLFYHLKLRSKNKHLPEKTRTVCIKEERMCSRASAWVRPAYG